MQKDTLNNNFGNSFTGVLHHDEAGWGMHRPSAYWIEIPIGYLNNPDIKRLIHIGLVSDYEDVTQSISQSVGKHVYVAGCMFLPDEPMEDWCEFAMKVNTFIASDKE